MALRGVFETSCVSAHPILNAHQAAIIHRCHFISRIKRPITDDLWSAWVIVPALAYVILRPCFLSCRNQRRDLHKACSVPTVISDTLSGSRQLVVVKWFYKSRRLRGGLSDSLDKVRSQSLDYISYLFEDRKS